MGFVRFVLWTAVCVGLGVAAASVEVGGKTPVQHLRGAWRQQSPRLEKVKDRAEGVVDEVRHKVSAQDAVKGPTEQHSSADREAIDAIIARRR